MFFTKILNKSINFKSNLFYLIILFYANIGVYLSLNVGITHDEHHNFIDPQRQNSLSAKV